MTRPDRGAAATEIPGPGLRGTLVPLGLIALVALPLVGCGGSRAGAAAYHDPHPLPADTLTMPAAETGTYGGRFVYATISAPKSFNPLMGNEEPTTDVTQQMFAGLTEYDNETEVIYPQLAKSWDVSADGRSWTWHLRRGACFSDGVPITSADVTFMFQLLYDAKLHPSLQDLMMVKGQPFEVTAPDSYTVITTAAAPHALMAATVGSLRILPRHILEPAYRRGEFAAAYGLGTPPESLVTSGPFRLKTYTPGEKVVLTRNPYWLGVDARGQRLPYLDELVYLVVPDLNTAAIKFQAGEVDAVSNVKPEDYKMYLDGAAKGNYTLHDMGPSLNTSFLFFNQNRVRAPGKGKRVGDPVVGAVAYHWFSNREFRRAVSYAIDRQAIIRGPFYGEAIPNWSVPSVGSRTWGHHGITGFDFDRERASRILDSLGWKDRNGDGVREDDLGHPIAFTLETNSNNETRIAMLNLIRDDLSRVGIRATPTPVEFTTLISSLRQDLNYQCVLLGLGSATPPDPGMYANFVRSSGLTHYWDIKQPHPDTPAEAEIDRLYDQVVSSTDEASRREPWNAIVRRLNDECFVIWLPCQMLKLPVSNRFGNIHPTATPNRVLWNIDRVFVKQHRLVS